MKIFELIRELDFGENNAVKISEIYDRCTKKGFTLSQIDDCIDEYTRDGIWCVDEHRTKVFFM